MSDTMTEPTEMYVVMRLQRWEDMTGTINYFPHVPASLSVEHCPGVGFMSVHETYEDAEAEFGKDSGTKIMKITVGESKQGGESDKEG